MMSRERLELDLDIAINDHDHVAYMAAARARWPLALIDLREAIETLNEISREALHREWLLTKADELVRAHDRYMQAFVRRGPTECAGEAAALVLAASDYRELRGLK